MTIDGVIQPIVSFLALAVWTWVYIRSEGPRRATYGIVWSFAAVFAVQSLTYIDVIGGDTARTIALGVRITLLVLGLFVLIRSVHGIVVRRDGR